eukprot:g1618.t1
MSDPGGVAADQLRTFVERIERLEEEKKVIADDIKDVYAEAKGNGYDVAILRKVVSLRKKQPHEREEEDAVLDLYMHALGMLATDTDPGPASDDDPGAGPAAPEGMASGRVVDLKNLRASDVHWPDLVESLVKLPRFNGATPHVTYTAAQHCCLMYDRAEDAYKAHALLSDFHAGYFGEISRSFVFLAAALSAAPDEFREAYHLARDEVTAAIYAAAGLREETDLEAFQKRQRYLRRLDKTLTATAQRDLMAPCALPGHWQLPAPFPIPVKPETAIMTIKDVIADTKLGESTIYQLMAKGTFPTCFNLIGRKTVWLRSEIETWKRWRIEQGKGDARWVPPGD